MAGDVRTEVNEAKSLNTSRVPVGPHDAGDKKTKNTGDLAVMDAVLIIAAAWAILFVLVFSLRAHNI